MYDLKRNNTDKKLPIKSPIISPVLLRPNKPKKTWKEEIEEDLKILLNVMPLYILYLFKHNIKTLCKENKNTEIGRI